MRTVPFVLLVPSVVAFYVALATLMTGSRTRRALCIVVAIAGLAAPWFAPATPLLARAFVALGSALYTMRIADLARMRPRGWSAARRAVHVLSIVDSRYLTRAEPRVEWRTFLIGACFALGTAAALRAVERLPLSLDAATGWIVRWIAGVTLLYCCVDGLFYFVRVGYRIAGFVVPDVHRHPILSRSVQEFWGERWNRPVSVWLREHCLVPLARRRRMRAGVVLAFVASAVLHAYIALPELGVVAAASAGAFFVVQSLVVSVETRLGVRRWPAWAAHAWSIASVLVWSPLLIEPVLRICAPGVGISPVMRAIAGSFAR